MRVEYPGAIYPIRLNHRHQLSGGVFSGHYRSPVIGGSGTGYVKMACDYVHLNPVRAKLRNLKSGSRLTLDSGELRQETAEAKAERIIAEELGKLGWAQSELFLRRKRDAVKLAIAARLRRETTLSLKAIASRLSPGSSKSANATLHRWMNHNANLGNTQSQLNI
jgi:hypothetical protein